MRAILENPFVTRECEYHHIRKAPIQTFLYETYGQCNEDLIIEGILRAYTFRSGRQMNSLRYLEIGANHPVQTSATYLLRKLYGATGVLVEANPALLDALRKTRPGDIIIHSAITATDAPEIELHVHEKDELSSLAPEHIARFGHFGGTEKITSTIKCPNMHINTLMKMHDLHKVDFMSIDIEGLDLPILAAMDTVFKPFLIQCELSVVR